MISVFRTAKQFNRAFFNSPKVKMDTQMKLKSSVLNLKEDLCSEEESRSSETPMTTDATSLREEIIAYHLKYIRKNKLRDIKRLLFKPEEKYFFLLKNAKRANLDESSLSTSNPQQRPKNMLSNHDITTPGLDFTNYIAVDCEMISTKQNNNTLARVSAVNLYGVLLYDTFVEPQSRVTHWRTRWSGVSPNVILRARKKGNIVSFDQAQSDLVKILNDRFLVGHALKNDLRALQISHPVEKTIDTQLLPRFNKGGLKNLLSKHFQIEIQKGEKGHDSVEDALASMLLFRTYQEEFTDILSLKHAPSERVEKKPK